MTRTELLFAPWAVRALRDARGYRWKRLVEQITALPETDPDSLAFQLMMVRLNGCLTCDARRYAERGGCATCSLMNLSFSKETDASLVERYRATRKEIGQALRAGARLPGALQGQEKRELSKAA